MFGLFKPKTRGPQTPRGRRAYAVGDVHGRLDLLDALLNQIERDVASRPKRETYLILLGDLIDRGPHSREVVERLRTYAPRGIKPVFLIGNHEEILLRLLAGERGILASWLKFGGAECARSYGIDPRQLGLETEQEALALLNAAVPSEHAEFLRSFADTFRFGDYLFVHAGIRPGVDVALQNQLDLRWIRSPFLEDETDHGFMVVHGHTISPDVDERPNRIGIDTGAYRSGVLTAVGLEGGERWYLSTSVQAPAATSALVE